MENGRLEIGTNWLGCIVELAGHFGGAIQLGGRHVRSMLLAGVAGRGRDSMARMPLGRQGIAAEGSAIECTRMFSLVRAQHRLCRLFPLCLMTLSHCDF